MKTKSLTKIKQQAARKTNPAIKETINLARKNKNWREVAALLSMPTRKYVSLNLFEIDKETKAGDTVVIVGKVLSKGDLTKKVRICALAFSEKAKEKIKDAKGEVVALKDEINKNPKMEGVKVIK